MYFTNKDTWSGGYYELAIELGNRSDERLLAALKALWKHPSLDGCYLDRNREPIVQNRVMPPPDLHEPGHLHGLAYLADNYTVACGSFIVREDGDGSDWLVLYLPFGALADVYPVGGFPFGKNDSGKWRNLLDEWLKEIGEYLHAIVPYRLALIGFQVSGEDYAAEIDLKGIPKQRFEGYLWEEDCKLVWYPANHLEPMYS